MPKKAVVIAQVADKKSGEDAAELRGQAEFIKKQLTQLEAEKRAMATDTKVSALS